jgi:hypothetical protein
VVNLLFVVKKYDIRHFFQRKSQYGAVKGHEEDKESACEKGEKADNAQRGSRKNNV